MENNLNARLVLVSPPEAPWVECEAHCRLVIPGEMSKKILGSRALQFPNVTHYKYLSREAPRPPVVLARFRWLEFCRRLAK